VKPHTFHPEAIEEYAKAAEYYAAINPELGGRFYDEVDGLVVAVCQQPQRFFQIDPPLRRALARRFPYSIVYLDKPDQIWIVAVMHAKRRPGYWRERVNPPNLT